ncbi:thioredoxin [Pyxidicoccus fallax]|uniref:Thioredoxin n=1 Tax=Pyxidicoccus fallax TaxID=394095 RepID=A0A848LWV8_9BACT|nr:thioredoxin family protein [Pyxidicoccus fallax]NMO22119.1 thioredoxin [Pyxidicoccus fallax]NPC83617.1 thioredoxin [Pyxidicoccus fallax]
MRLRHVAWLLLALWGCGASTTAAHRPTTAESGLPFVEDDYAAALREAREKRLPLFVEAWAPWCQSCRAMRATVLPDPALRPQAEHFVWLAIDTDKPGNEDFLRRFPIDTWPTMLVVDPEQERVVARSLGAMSVPQLLGFLEQSRRTYQQDPRELAEVLARADSLALAGDHPAAAMAYQQTLARLPQDAPLRAVTAVSLLKSLTTAGASEECARLTVQELPLLSRVDDRAKLLYVGIGCALDLKTEEAVSMRAKLEEESLRDLKAPADALVAPLRSSLYEASIELRMATDDEAGTKARAEEWLAFLDEHARNARSAEERSALDNHRVYAAFILDAPDRVIPALEQSERALPWDYTPPARLAQLYQASGQLDRALEASQRALARVSGAGRFPVLATHARILVARGEPAKAEQVLTEALKELERTPDAPGVANRQRMLQATLAQVRAQAK